MILDKPTMGPVAIARLRPEGEFIERFLAISTAAPFSPAMALLFR